jgi:peroxiredoxin
MLDESLAALRLPDESGATVPVVTAGRPTVIVLFRGTWCPYCRAQLSKMAQALRDYSDFVDVVAITVDPPDLLQTMKHELKLPFRLLSDSSALLMKRCGGMHCIAVTDRDGVVRWTALSGNWRSDLPERSVLQLAYRHR